MYLSICKKEHAIIFTFIVHNDYNLFVTKLSLFAMGLILDFATNTLFFTDETMHSIYVNYGGYDFLTQIPITIYSLIITEVFDISFKGLVLTDNVIYKLKQSKNHRMFSKQVNEAIKKIKN